MRASDGGGSTWFFTVFCGRGSAGASRVYRIFFSLFRARVKEDIWVAWRAARRQQ